MIIETTIEPNKIAASLMKFPAVIVGIFVALYAIAIDAANGSSHSIELGFVPISSGAVKLAITTKSAIDILASGCLCAA